MRTKTVIVTGASRGIGRTIARAFAREGINLALVGRNIEHLSSLSRELEQFNCKTLPLVVDVRNPAEVGEMVNKTLKSFGSIDILINNAGTPGPTASVEETEVDAWFDVMNSNLTSTFLCCKYVVPQMKVNRWGRIINLSSISGKRPLPFRVGYCAAKMGVIGLTRTIASEVGPYGITVNAICPGFVEGDRMMSVIAGQSRARGVAEETVRTDMVASSPIKRFVRPEEVAEMVVYLARDDAAGITGEDINVSAGVVMY